MLDALNPEEQAKMTKYLKAADESGVLARNADVFGRLLPFMVCVMVIVALVFIGLGDHSRLQGQINEARDSAQRADLSTQRNLATVTFICEDLSYDDAWQRGLRDTERRNFISSQLPAKNDFERRANSWHSDRIKLFEAREKHATFRRQKCDQMIKSFRTSPPPTP